MKLTARVTMLVALAAGCAYGSAAKYSALYTFECAGNAFERIGTCPQGGRPDSLTIGSDGNFYGAAQDSEEGTSAPNGGTVFQLTPAGKLTVLHTFAPGANKKYPNGNLPGILMQGPDRKIYGYTLYGGVDGCNGYCGYGVLYRVNTDGSGFQIIHKGCSDTNCTDGGIGLMVVGTDGNIYGTGGGGTGNCGSYNGCGTIFRITPSTGAYEVAFDFSSSTCTAPSGITLGSDGTFYGTCEGSSGQALFHYFEATGQFETYNMDFQQFNPLSSGFLLTLGPNGNFYGIYGIYGVSGEGVFEIEPNGSNLQLFNFFTTQDGGGDPQTMILASDGNFWLDEYNGSTGYGSIVTLSPADGSLIQTLSPFSANAAIGAYPAELIQASNGRLWGTTYGYGKNTKNHFGDGTVFSVNAGLPPRN